ncbi:MAG: hypothetical protein J2O48_03120, partial [Solirubrobacterales bacterium]|nr:hypothetical protein [Solirubrobacterales bacterium]
ERTALEKIAATINHDPTLDMLYSDEDIVDDGRQIWVHHKQAWSPDLERVNGYTCHLGVYRRSILVDIGGFRDELNGSQDVDMILRFTERTDRVASIPEILYHWRMHAASTAGGDAKPYAYIAAQRAIGEQLTRLGVAGRVEPGPPGLYRVVHEVPQATSVDVIVADTAHAPLQALAQSLLGESEVNWRLIICAPEAELSHARRALGVMGVTDDRLVLSSAEGSAPVRLATGAAQSRADHLLLSPTPFQALTSGWLVRLLGYSAEAGIAAAGPLVLGPDGLVRHAGVAMVNGIPLYLLRGGTTSMDLHFGYGTCVHNVSALDGVLVTSRGRYEELGGLDSAHGSLALVDYSLRAYAAGYRLVSVPDARLAVRSDSASNNISEMHLVCGTSGRDPYYNINYRSDRGDFTVATI